MHINNHEDFVKTMYDIFISNWGRIPNLERILCFFPDLSSKINETIYYLLDDDSSISRESRCYLAIMVI